MNCSPPGSSVHEILQARVLEWGAIAFSAEWLKRGIKTIFRWYKYSILIRVWVFLYVYTHTHTHTFVKTHRTIKFRYVLFLNGNYTFFFFLLGKKKRTTSVDLLICYQVSGQLGKFLLQSKSQWIVISHRNKCHNYRGILCFSPKYNISSHSFLLDKILGLNCSGSPYSSKLFSIWHICYFPFLCTLEFSWEDLISRYYAFVPKFLQSDVHWFFFKN